VIRGGAAAEILPLAIRRNAIATLRRRAQKSQANATDPALRDERKLARF
jgi:hypothetical protein